MEDKTIFEKLFDENDDSNIILYDEEEKAVEFEQIAIIPVKEDVYAILKPVKPMEGMDEDTGLVFLLEESEDGEEFLNVVEDEDIIDVVFAEYEKLLNEDK